MRSIAVVLTLSAFLSAGDPPTVVTSKLVTGPSSHVELTNTGKQPVTAWSFAVTTKKGEGAFHRELHMAEVYLAEVTRGLPGSRKQLDWLLPGETRQIPLDQLPADATVEMVAVVLEDGTGLGDTKTLKAIFDRRGAERDALRQVVDTFNTVLSAKRGIPAIEELKDRFNASIQQPESTPHRSAREAVESYLGRATPANTDEIDQAIRKYAEFVARQLEVASRHSRSKTL